MIRVILESPYAGASSWRLIAWWQRRQNIRFARAAMRDCLSRNEAPIASHLLYTQPGILRDGDPYERQWGIEAGLLWGELAEKTVVYTARGTSRGMELGLDAARRDNRPIEYREGLLP